VRKRFSEKYGLKKDRDSIQINSMDVELKNRLWNQIQKYYFDRIEVSSDAMINPQNIIRCYGSRNMIEVSGDRLCQIINEKDYDFFRTINDAFLKIDEKPSNFIDDINIKLKDKYKNFQWYEIYDFIEFISSLYHNKKINNEFTEVVNKVLEEEMSGYRFVKEYIVPIIDNIEIQEIEKVLDSDYGGVKMHLSKSLELLSDRENPDYQNSIKESITAVESVAKMITGKDTDLAGCLKVMDLDLNKQFKTAMTNMYGWTCKEDGIRHGHTGEKLKTSFEEAKYMLVTCSAFVNYMIAKKGTE